MRIGLFFGSFNPVHIGHLIIASLVHQKCELDKIWFVLSPQNPLKQKSNLLNEYDRLHLLRLSIQDNDAFDVCTVEFELPKPSYTIDTLQVLENKYPKYTFYIIIGEDILDSLKKWKNYELLTTKYHFLIINRESNSTKQNQIELPQNHTFLDVPILNISSSQIRNMLKNNLSIKYPVS